MSESVYDGDRICAAFRSAHRLSEKSSRALSLYACTLNSGSLRTGTASWQDQTEELS